MTCFFIGHRDAPAELRLQLAEAVERHIAEYGVREFVVGHYGRFDALAAAAVRQAKKRHPQVTLTLLLPYYRATELWEGFDRTFYPEGLEQGPQRAAILRANRCMIERSRFLICYDRGIPGNTRDLAALARRRQKRGLIRVTELAR
ncbi:MAG: hypothetical protein IIZ45_02430 [Firmicutes bacterium]|nr:hypothetical protein [Bacillota bacterium]